LDAHSEIGSREISLVELQEMPERIVAVPAILPEVPLVGRDRKKPLVFDPNDLVGHFAKGVDCP
jgi:hypothetical protein